MSPLWRWVSLSLLASVVLVAIAAQDLANHRYIGADEPWIMSASYNLAFDGRLGSDTWAGFYGAEDHWFISLPLFNFAQAGVFLVLGPGIAEARLVSVLAGVALLWLAGWFAFRAFGTAVAGVTLGVLLLARVSLDISVPGIPLIVLARVARYDMLANALFWVVIVLLYRWSERINARRPVIIGVVCGLAALTQFYGFVTLAVVAAYWLCRRREPAHWRAATIAAVAFALTIAPYGVFVVLHWQDFVGQLSLKPGRYGFEHPKFYLLNLRDEYLRYQWIVDPFIDQIGRRAALVRAVIVGVLLFGAALAATMTRQGAIRRNDPALRLLWMSLVVPFVALALVDSTKLFLYAIVMLPSLVMLAAIGWVGMARGLLSYRGHPLMGFARTLVIVGVTVLIVATGLQSWREDRAFAHETNRYVDVGAEIERYLAPGATVIGPDRWWWALREHKYVSLLGLLAGLHDHDASVDPSPMAEHVRPTGAMFMIINDGSERWFEFYRPDLEPAFWEWIDQCTTRTAQWVDPKYGPIRIYRIELSRSGPVCGVSAESG